MRALVLQHLACEGPGVFGDVLAERGIETTTAHLDLGDQSATGEPFDLVIAMGGPMSVNDESDLPWLVGEKRLIRDAVVSGTPFWGVCLGAQLLASSLGARVYPGARPEVGVMPVQLTSAAAADPVFAGLPVELPTFQWHGDTFDLPADATLLAGSPEYPHQAFRLERAYGIQFHLEVSQAMAAEWAAIPAYRQYAERVHGAGGLERVLDEFAGAQEGLTATARTMFETFLDRVVA